jgi:hypothetical protein
MDADTPDIDHHTAEQNEQKANSNMFNGQSAKDLNFLYVPKCTVEMGNKRHEMWRVNQDLLNACTSDGSA